MTNQSMTAQFLMLLQVTIKNAFSQWKMKCLRVQVARVSLEALLQKEILQRYFDSWKSIVSFSNSLRYL